MPATPQRLAQRVPPLPGRPWSWFLLARSLIAARWVSLRRPSAPPPRQLVVCGFPRAGTSLVYNMLASSLQGFVFTEFETSALDCLWRRESFASKSPMDVFNLAQLARRNLLGKQLLVLMMIRDVRDVITSVHPNLPNQYFCSYASRWRIVGSYPYQVKPSPWGIRAFDEAIDGARSISGLPLEIIRYESLVRDPDAEQQRLAERHALVFSAPFSTFHHRSEKHAYRYLGDTLPKEPGLVRESSSVTNSRIGRWRLPEHRARIREQFLSHPELFGLLTKHGWEPDDSWFEEYRQRSVSR